MGHFAKKSTNIVCVKIETNDPICVNAQEWEIAWAIDVDGSSLRYYCVAYKGISWKFA